MSSSPGRSQLSIPNKEVSSVPSTLGSIYYVYVYVYVAAMVDCILNKEVFSVHSVLRVNLCCLNLFLDWQQTVTTVVGMVVEQNDILIPM